MAKVKVERTEVKSETSQSFWEAHPVHMGTALQYSLRGSGDCLHLCTDITSICGMGEFHVNCTGAYQVGPLHSNVGTRTKCFHMECAFGLLLIWHAHLTLCCTATARCATPSLPRTQQLCYTIVQSPTLYTKHFPPAMHNTLTTEQP